MSRGLSVVDPSQLLNSSVPAIAHVEVISADGNPIDIGESVRIPASRKKITLSYSGLSFAAPQRIRFRYFLDGFDHGWSEPVAAREAVYTNLAPGSYRFRVTASNSDGAWNGLETAVSFEVEPAYYQTTWFRASCVVLFLVLLWALYQFRVHQLARQFNVGLEARVSERTRIARELHDTLLQSFQGLMFRFQAARDMLPRRSEEAMQALDGALTRAEQAIAEGRAAIQDLRSEPAGQTDLEHLLKAMGQELASSQDANRDSPNFNVTVEGERQSLSPILQDEIYRIGRELLRNAFQHAGASQIESEIRYDDRVFRLRIRDDGKGIDPKLLEEGARPGHRGLPGIRERAKRIGARLDFWSEAGAGTEIQLIVPVPGASDTSRDGPKFRVFRKAGNHDRKS
jgi:signal transduction histidine kinase